MDSVPYKFVDAVVELLDEETLESLMKKSVHPVWNQSSETHKQNRYYGDVWFRQVDGIVQCGLNHKVIGMDDVKSIGRRFVRFVAIYDQTNNNNVADWDFIWDEGLKFEEADVGEMIKVLMPYFMLSGKHNSLTLLETAFNLQNTILENLYKKLYFTTLDIKYTGEAACNFLKDHIDNHEFLKGVDLHGDWPASIVPYIEKFCLQNQRPRYLTMRRTTHSLLDWTHIEELFAYWKENENIDLHLKYYTHAEDTNHSEKYAKVMKDDVEANEGAECRYYYLKHERIGSISRCCISPPYDGQSSVSLTFGPDLFFMKKKKI
ncbi:hypothetical protein QR680_007937 [Steinernema hermaphroditum]|uniref:Uncharacterized protein n=1 Tax=Steinernema hermaphroditum TaxID=289476 RepID=A0AA39IGB7_9BILA|nr:hypothetical protein QR680_007937 [Steinernema hermaphroditum]